MSEEDDKEAARRAALHADDRPAVLNPPSAIAAAVELGAKWAEDVAMRQCLYLPVVEWPAWPPYDEAKPAARRHAAKLVADLHLHVRHRRPSQSSDQPPRAPATAPRRGRRVARVTGSRPGVADAVEDNSTRRGRPARQDEVYTRTTAIAGDGFRQGSRIRRVTGSSGRRECATDPIVRSWRWATTFVSTEEVPSMCGTGQIALFAVGVALASGCNNGGKDPPANDPDAGVSISANDPTMAAAADFVTHGRQIFRFDTFGDEAFWAGELQLHRAIEGSAHGGVGPGLSPQAALSLGLKVDAEALPANLVAALQANQVDLNDPASTLALLQANAVLGVQATFAADGTLAAIGLTCAVCHSIVDNSFAPGIGRRLDGWANRDLNVGQVIALAPNLAPLAAVLGVDVATVRTVLQSWGPGKFDAELILDGKAFRPDGRSAATLIPPAFGMAGVNLHTWTGWGSVPEWNAFVAVLELHGIGNFADFRLADPTRFPIAAKNHFDHVVVRPDQDRVTSKLSALQVYQLSLVAPSGPAGSFDAAAAARGHTLFLGKALCATCHVPPLYTEPGFNAHRASEIGIDDFQAQRGPVDAYRTAPLRGLYTHQKGGFYHDGRFATLGDVVNHYDAVFMLGLTTGEKNDLIEYLKSL